MTQQGLRQASARNLSGFATGTNYNEDFLRLFDAQGVAAGTFDERQLRWINARMGATFTNLDEAMQAYATGQGVYNWSSLGALEDTANFTRVMPYGATYTRTGAATGLTTAGLITSFAADTAQRTDRGLALEPERTNLLLRSQEFNSAEWNKGTGGSIAANTVVAPDGTTTADAYTWATATSDFAFLSQTVNGNAAQALPFSVWLKVPSGTRTIRLRISDVTTSNYNPTTVTLTTEWQLVTLVAPAATLTNSGSIGVGFLGGASGTPIAAGDVLHVWQADLNADATFVTSPIFTTTATATRGLPVFTEVVPAGRTKALLTYADATTTLVTGLTPGGTFDVATTVIAASKGRFASSELVTRVWQA